MTLSAQPYTEYSLSKYKESPNLTKEMTGSHKNKERETHYNTSFTKKEMTSIMSYLTDGVTLDKTSSRSSTLYLRRYLPSP
jgi:signal transduction histidine kinase